MKNEIVNNNKLYILNSPDSLNYITDKLNDIFPNKIDEYKKIFKIDFIEPIKINYFDDIDKFRSFIYDIRGRKDTLPSYAVGTYDKGMINAYIDPNIIVDSPKYKKKLYLPCHELFHILYMKYILKNDYSKRIVWYDEGMAQFLSGEKNELLDEVEFNSYFNKVKDNTKIIPELNNLEHGNSFSNDNYDGYALSYLSIRYLSEILDENEFYDLMSDFNKIRNYGSTIIQDMFNYYTDKFENKMK